MKLNFTVHKLVAFLVLFIGLTESLLAVPREDLDLSLVPPVVNMRPWPPPISPPFGSVLVFQRLSPRKVLRCFGASVLRQAGESARIR